MAFLTRHSIPITTDASGNATVYSSDIANGFVQAVRYVPDGTTPMDNTADLTVTGETSGIPIITITNEAASVTNYAPRMATHDITGAPALFAAAGQAVNDKIPLAGERIKVAVAQGGNTKSGTLNVWVGG